MVKPWGVEFLEPAKKDIRKLDKGTQERVILEIRDTARLIAESDGNYGKPLGHKSGIDLTGCYKIRVGHIRVVYTKQFIESKMVIVVMGVRSDRAAYQEAAKRLNR